MYGDDMDRRSILGACTTIALGLALFGITAGAIARAAEIGLLCVVALHPEIDALIPDFEKSSLVGWRLRPISQRLVNLIEASDAQQFTYLLAPWGIMARLPSCAVTVAIHIAFCVVRWLSPLTPQGVVRVTGG
jgi:hypothetical protein